MKGLIYVVFAWLLAISQVTAQTVTITPAVPVGPWTAYTPTLGCGTGSLTSATGSGRYQLIGKTLYIGVNIAITTNGTCATSLTFTLPSGLTTQTSFAMMGKDFNVGTLDIAYVSGAGSTLTSVNATTAAYPYVNGSSVTYNGVVEVQ
jgi:hypothetical protein